MPDSIQYKEAPAPSKGELNTVDSKIGTLSNLETTVKTNTVLAINEVRNSIVKPITIALDDVTNVSGSYTHTTNVATSGLITEGMKPIGIEVSDSTVFRDKVIITVANNTITLTCADVVGTSEVNVTLMRVQTASSAGVEPTSVTSEEFDILANRIGDLTDLDTMDKTSMVNAVNEVNAHLGNISIGPSNTSQSTSTSSGTFKTIQSFSVSEAGSYLIVATAQFSADTNGIRILVVTTSSSGENSVENSVVAFGRATLERVQPMVLDATETVYIRVYQTSGSSMNVLTSYRIVRIA